MTLLEMLLGRMAKASGENLYVSSGAVQMPEITKNDATGEITVGEGIYRLYHTDDFTGEISEHTIDGDTFTIPDDNTSYAIIADYNNGFPIIRMGATNDYNDSSTLGILTVAYSTLVGISVIDWGREAVGAVNKLTVKSYASGEKYAIESGLSVSVENTREIVVSNGNVFVGIEKQFKPEVHSSTDKCLLHKSTASGEITRELITAYSSTVYDNETGTLATLADDSYGVLWVWRSMSDLKLIDVMYGSNSYYSETAAREANLPTNTPNSLGNNALLLGRLIYEKGSNTADFVAAVNGGIGSGGVTSHLSLTDVQGGGNGIYNHSDQNINKNASNVLFNSMAVGGLTGSRSYNLQAVNSFGVSSPNNAIKYFYATSTGAGLGDDKPFIWGLNNDFNAQYSNSLDALIFSNGTGVATAPYLYLWENKVGIGRKPNYAMLEVEDDFRVCDGSTLLGRISTAGAWFKGNAGVGTGISSSYELNVGGHTNLNGDYSYFENGKRLFSVDSLGSRAGAITFRGMVMMQWGRATITSDSNSTIGFYTAFGEAPVITLAYDDDDSNNSYPFGLVSTSYNGFVFNRGDGYDGTGYLHWFAIGKAP